MDADDRDATAEQPGERNHSFVVRVWVEESGRQRRTWRGHVTNAVTRERRDIRDLGDIGLFIMPYLEQAGVRFQWCWRAFRWLKRPRWKPGTGAC
jgi:hypothetical protein